MAKNICLDLKYHWIEKYWKKVLFGLVLEFDSDENQMESWQTGQVSGYGPTQPRRSQSNGNSRPGSHFYMPGRKAVHDGTFPLPP